MTSLEEYFMTVFLIFDKFNLYTVLPDHISLFNTILSFEKLFVCSIMVCGKNKCSGRLIFIQQI